MAIRSPTRQLKRLLLPQLGRPTSETRKRPYPYTAAPRFWFYVLYFLLFFFFADEHLFDLVGGVEDELAVAGAAGEGEHQM